MVFMVSELGGIWLSFLGLPRYDLGATSRLGIVLLEGTEKLHRHDGEFHLDIWKVTSS